MIFHALEYVFEKIRLCMMKARHINAGAIQRILVHEKIRKTGFSI